MGDPAVAAAMQAMPRQHFLPEDQRHRAGIDAPVPLGRGQTNSQPTTVRRMLELLEVAPGQRVLDVGSGSGWTTALLAHLVGPTGCVIGVELDAGLARWGAANVRAQNVPWAVVRQADPPVLGWPAEAPYDRILVSAEAKTLPDQLVAQLGVGGLMVIPVARRMLRVRRVSEADTVVSKHGSYAFVPLR